MIQPTAPTTTAISQIPITRRVVVDDGVELVASSWGQGAPLLLVHGFGGAKEDFADHVTDLAQRFQVVTFDLRGHGESDKPANLSAYSLERLRADTVAVADAFGFDQFVLLGHSMGGMVVRRIPLDHPDRVTALVMMDTSAGPLPGMDLDIVELAVGVAVNEGKDALKALLDFAAPFETPSHRRLVERHPDYQAFCDRKWDNVSEIMWAALARELANQPDDLDEMRSLTIPVLVMIGETDAAFLDASDAMCEAIPTARKAVIADAGHSPQFENPEVWYGELAGFLASL